MEKIAFLFPGQGSQYVGMVKTLFDDFAVVKQTFAEAEDTLGMSIKQLCFEGSLVELNKTENMLPALLTASVAAFRAYMQEIGIEPAYCAGHSLGEYSALTCSGAMAFADALKIVRLRGLLAQEAADKLGGTMTVINGVYKSIVEEECQKSSLDGELAVVGCYNSPEQVVISGHGPAITRAEDRLVEMEAQITPLLMSAPFHSPLLEKAANTLKDELEKYVFNDFRWPVISNVSALPYSSKEQIIKNLTLQLIKPVRWDAIMKYLEERDVAITIELGPQAILSNLVGMTTQNIKAVAFGQKDDRQTLARLFSVKPRGESEADQNPIKNPVTLITRCLAIGICTRNRNWDEEEYQKGVIEPYEKIEKLQEELEKEGREPSIAEMRAALEMLKSVFNTKKTSKELQVARFNQIFNETGTCELFKDFLVN